LYKAKNKTSISSLIDTTVRLIRGAWTNKYEYSMDQELAEAAAYALGKLTKWQHFYA